jgi:hypothetical protein
MHEISNIGFSIIVSLDKATIYFVETYKARLSHLGSWHKESLGANKVEVGMKFFVLGTHVILIQ